MQHFGVKYGNRISRALFQSIPATRNIFKLVSYLPSNCSIQLKANNQWPIKRNVDLEMDKAGFRVNREHIASNTQKWHNLQYIQSNMQLQTNERREKL